MLKVDNKEQSKKLRILRDELTKKITELDKSSKNKSEAELKQLIKLCKEFENYTNQLQNLGVTARIWHTRLDYRTWDSQLKSKTSIKNLKKPKQTFKQEITSDTSMYYVMLCWTARQDYCICENIIKNIQNYFEKMHLEYMDVMTNDFPDRIEYCKTYKLKATPEVYKTIINSAEYIIEISTGTIYEKCNIGVYGQKLE